MNLYKEYFRILKENEEKRMKKSLEDTIEAYKVNSEKILEQIRELNARIKNLECERKTTITVIETPQENCNNLKKKCTYYIGEKELKMLNEIFITTLQSKFPRDRSEIVCSAIRRFYEYLGYDISKYY